MTVTLRSNKFPKPSLSNRSLLTQGSGGDKINEQQPQGIEMET